MASELMSQPDWQSRLSLAVDHLLTTGQFSSQQDVAQAAESFYRKLMMADKYKPSAVLGTGLLLVRASAGHSEAKELGEDFGLSEVMVKWFSKEHKVHMEVSMSYCIKASGKRQLFTPRVFCVYCRCAVVQSLWRPCQVIMRVSSLETVRSRLLPFLTIARTAFSLSVQSGEVATADSGQS